MLQIVLLLDVPTAWGLRPSHNQNIRHSSTCTVVELRKVQRKSNFAQVGNEYKKLVSYLCISGGGEIFRIHPYGP
jgi:hypothetical protein